MPLSSIKSSAKVLSVAILFLFLITFINQSNAYALSSDQLIWPDAKESAISQEGSATVITNGEQRPLPIASVAKLITALCVLKAKPLEIGQTGPVFTMNEADLGLYTKYMLEDGSTFSVVLGQKLNEYEMLQAMLIPSANNIADSLAIKVYGSLANYQEYANSYLSKLSLSQTHVGLDASGFSPTTTSNAIDLVKLGKLVEQNQLLSSIAAQSETKVANRLVVNTDSILGNDGVTGLKTGFTVQAGGAFVGSSQLIYVQDNILIISSVLGSPTLNAALNNSLNLIQSAQNQLVSGQQIH